MDTARGMARRIKRQQENARKKAIRETGLIGILFLVVGSIVVTAGYATDNPYGAAFGGVVMLAGAVFGILWAVSDDR